MWKYHRIFLIAFSLCVLLTPLMAAVARRLRVLDQPKERGMHKKATPLLGGVGMYLGFVAAVLLQMDYSAQLKGVLVASTLIFFIGLLDDLFDLRASLKLGVQVMACIVLMEHGVVLKVFYFESLNVLFTVVGIIGITNAANFLDNMDGLAAGLVAIAGFIFFAIAVSAAQYWLGYLAIALGASSCGFLLFNFKPAKIFMGDCGSTFAGFTLASLAVLGEWSYSITSAVAIPVLAMGVFIFDMIMITVLRIKNKKVRNFRQWLSFTGKDHLSHRLHHLGMSDRQAVLMVYVGSSLLGCAAYAIFLQSSNLLGLLGIGGYAMACVAGILLLDAADKGKKKT